MKYPVHAALPDWHIWSDGRLFSPGETKRFRKMWKHCRLSGESPRRFFERVRAVIEGNTAHAREEYVMKLQGYVRWYGVKIGDEPTEWREERLA